MRGIALFLLALIALSIEATPAFAQALPSAPNFGPGFGAGIGMGLAIVGIGVGLGLIGYSAISGIARQPESAGRITGVMYVLAALVEGAGIIALVLCLVLPLIAG